MLVTLDIYSGRPNPTWELTGEEVKEALERFSGRMLAKPTELPDKLGYRGFILSASTQDEFVDALPDTYTAAIGGVIAEERKSDYASPLTVEESTDAVRWLLTTARHAIDDELREYVEKRASGAAVEATATESTALESAPPLERAIPCQPYDLPYVPEFWNVDPWILLNNNCYNYAVGWRSDTKAQPGLMCGRPFSSYTVSELTRASLCDGLRTTCSGQNGLTALVL